MTPIKFKLHDEIIKTIVFDLNGTISTQISNNPYYMRFRNNYIQSQLSNVSSEILSKTSATKVFKSLKLDCEDFYEYRKSNFDWSLLIDFNKEIYQLLKSLKSAGYNLVIYSNCRKDQLDATLDILQLSCFFDLILSQEDDFIKPNFKGYLYISNCLDTSIDQMVMISDNTRIDLKPLESIGGNTIHIRNSSYLPKAISKVIQHNLELEKGFF